MPEQKQDPQHPDDWELKQADSEEFLISVDVETAGPNPGTYSLLSIGACALNDTSRNFYAELKPTSTASTEESLQVSGLSMADLAETGLEPEEAMARFETWISEVTPKGAIPVFLGFNAAFDWMFVCDYFWRYLGRNPFGHSAIDIKSVYLGKDGGSWWGTSMRYLAEKYLESHNLSHNAMKDAVDQAVLFSKMLEDHSDRASRTDSSLNQ
ncbi:MAG: 3'-5' exonuclease [Microbacteriaceae bacterium]|nr:3'-5' exonuclease [Microbacteriaceae bacterium]